MEGDDDKLEDSDCLPQLLQDVQSAMFSSYFAHVLTHRGIYLRVAFISLSASHCATFIQGRRLFVEIR